MGNLGGGEILVILVVALLVLGPTRLPTAARQVGNAIGELRKLSSGFQNEMKSAMDEVSLDGGDSKSADDESDQGSGDDDRRARSRRLVAGSTDGADTAVDDDLGARNGFVPTDAESSPDTTDTPTGDSAPPRPPAEDDSFT